MIFQAETIKTTKWRRTIYGVISLSLFAISIVVIYILAPKDILERDYLSEWFGQHRKQFLILNLLFNLNGIVLMILENRFNYKTIGNVIMTDEKITINQRSESIVYNIQEIAAIRLYYYGYKSFWKSWGKGNQNFITIVDQQNNECVFEFFLRSYEHKKNLIDQLLSFQKQGIKIILDYLNPQDAYPNDVDFTELKVLERWHNKKSAEKV